MSNLFLTHTKQFHRAFSIPDKAVKTPITNYVVDCELPPEVIAWIHIGLTVNYGDFRKSKYWYFWL